MKLVASQYSSALSGGWLLWSAPCLPLGLRWLVLALAVARAPLALSFVLMSCSSVFSSAPRLLLGLRWLVLVFDVAGALLGLSFLLRGFASPGSVWIPSALSCWSLCLHWFVLAIAAAFTLSSYWYVSGSVCSSRVLILSRLALGLPVLHVLPVLARSFAARQPVLGIYLVARPRSCPRYPTPR